MGIEPTTFTFLFKYQCDALPTKLQKHKITELLNNLKLTKAIVNAII